MRFFLLTFLVACTGYNEFPHRCKADKDCPNGALCVFSVEDGCDGRGHCGAAQNTGGGVPRPPPGSTTNPSCTDVACGCTGEPAFRRTTCEGFDIPIRSDRPCNR